MLEARGVRREAWTACTLLCVLFFAGCGLMPKRTTTADHTAPAASADSSQQALATPAHPPASTGKKSGAYYLDDGPGENPPSNLDRVPDAVPRAEPLRVGANKPYSVFGKEYVPQTSLRPFKQRGVASWYGKKFQGAKTSSGELYDMYGMTAAHPTLPIPSYARVTNISNKRSVVVRINDRGPFLSDRIMDLSYTAAYKLGYVQAGSATVEVESIDPANFHPSASASTPTPARNAILVPEMVVEAIPNLPPPVSSQATATPIPAPMPPPTVESRPLESSPAPSATPVETPTPAATPVLPVSEDASGVYLQLGAFSVRDNAEAFRNRIYQQLGWLNQTIHVRTGGGLYRLQLGPYRDRAEAEQVATRIRETLELKPAIVIK